MKNNLLLSIFSGLLLWLAWPPVQGTTFLLFVGLAPMLVAMENIIQADVRRKGKRIFRTVFIGFFIWNTLSVYWVYNALKMVGGAVALPISLIPYSLGPLLMSLACWLYYRARLLATRTWALFAFVCFWVGYEYLNQSWDLAFPWMTLGNGFAVAHQWVQWYEYTGVYGGTIWILLSNILIFLIYMGFKERQSKKALLKRVAAYAVVLILPLTWSLVRYYTYSEQPDPSNIVVAQPNIDPYAKVTSIPVAEQIRILTKLCDSAGQPNTEFFIWPETAIAPEPPVDEDNVLTNTFFLQAQRFLSKYKNGNIITGAETFKLYNTRATSTASPYGSQGNRFYDEFNAAINIENSGKVQFYHKSKLVPGAEAMPFGAALSFLKPVFEHLGGATGSVGSQASPSVFYSQSGIGAAPVICYETPWGGWVAQAVRKGAQFIALITNDGWWEDTSGKDQHLDYAKLRAIETRRWVCQSANTGISAFINQRGDIVKQTKWWVKTAIKQDINLNTDLTFYVLHGDYLAIAGSALAGLGVLFILYKAVKKLLFLH